MLVTIILNIVLMMIIMCELPFLITLVVALTTPAVHKVKKR